MRSSVKLTYGGTPGAAGIRRVTSEPMAGYWMAGVGRLPVVMKTVAGPCDGMVWARLRTTVVRSITRAINGRCSQMRTPSAEVLISRNSPRMPSGALGRRSHMSMVAGPPASQTMMTEVALRLHCGTAENL